MILRFSLLLGLVILPIKPTAAQVPQPADSVRDSSVTLPPIEVTVTRGSLGVRDAPLAISVLDRATLGRARQDLTIDDLLAGVPGVYVASRYNFSLDQRLSIRGFGSRSNFGIRGVKVLLDGVPQTLPDGQGQLTNVDIGAVERVEVIRGSASSLYGNASGGVIALESGPVARLPFSQSLRVEGGAFGLWRWQSRTSARSGGLGGALTLSRLSLDGFRNHSRAEAFQLQAAGEYILSGTMTATMRFSHADAPRADNPGALTLAELATDRRAAAPNNVARLAGKEVEQQQASVTLRHLGGEEDRTELTFFGFRRILDNPLATNVFVDLDRLAGGVRYSMTRGLGSGRAPRITVGADLQRMRDDRRNLVASGGQPTDTVLLDQLETVVEMGPFGHLLWRPTNRLLLSAGTRYDRVTFDVADHHLGDGVDNSGSRTMAALSGHIGASLTGRNAAVPYINVSTSFETPTTTELANRPGGSGGFNDQLDPQRAVNYELGVRGEPVRQLQYSAAVFVGRIRDALIQFREVGGRAFFSNAGRLNTDGLELGLGIDPHPALNISAAYTYAHYRFVDYRIVTGTTADTLDGNRLAGVPAHFLRIAVRTTPAAGLRIEIEQTISSSLFADDENTIEVGSWGAGVTSVRASWLARVAQLSLEPFLGVNNVFDRSYVSSVTVNGFGGRVFEPAPRRHGYFGMEVRYLR